jgi:hypothetical protein
MRSVPDDAVEKILSEGRDRWSTLVLRIREVPASNIGPETGFPESFRGSQVSPSEYLDYIGRLLVVMGRDFVSALQALWLTVLSPV